MRLQLLSSFSSAQGHKFMDTACGSRVEKLTYQLFPATLKCHHLLHAPL